MKVLLADDHALVRSGIRRLLEDMPDVVVTGEADDGEQAMEMIGHAVPDIVLADISMPRMTGLELVAALRRQGLEVPTVLISGHLTPAVTRQASAAGISVIEKPFLGNGLVELIRTATGSATTPATR